MAWSNESQITSIKYQCGHCGSLVASNKGFFSTNGQLKAYICPHCNQPSFFDPAGSQIPGISPGNDVQNLPGNLAALYKEARNCVSVSANTASVLACRKLLMNIAVEQGAKAGDSFISYVEFLANNGFVPPNGKGWVDHIRKKGNEATHEIALMTQADAEELISFSEMLLKFIYEFPAKVPTT